MGNQEKRAGQWADGKRTKWDFGEVDLGAFRELQRICISKLAEELTAPDLGAVLHSEFSPVVCLNGACTKLPALGDECTKLPALGEACTKLPTLAADCTLCAGALE